MPPKRPLTIEESEVADALAMLREKVDADKQASNAPVAAPQDNAPVPVDPPRAPVAEVVLKDGTSLDLTAFISATVESFMAKSKAMEQLGGVEARPGSSGFKRPIDPPSTHRQEPQDRNKRLRSDRVLTEVDHSQGSSQDEQESGESGSEEDEEEPFTFSSVFGVGINCDANPSAVGALRADARSSEVFTPPAQLSLRDESDRPVFEPDSGTGACVLGDDGVVGGDEEIDKDLYVPTKNSPNWCPTRGVLNWQYKYFDEEWDLERLKSYENRYIVPKEHKHLFTPIPLTKDMDQALSSQYTKDTDKYFNRRETERMLFRAAKDICASYGPILQALGSLASKSDTSNERNLLSEGILGIASAMIKITRARRELLRRYFDFSVARELYSFDPSHSQFFGGSSLNERVKEAKALAEARNNLFFRPKPKTNKSGRQGYPKSQGFNQGQGQYQQQKTQNRPRQNRGRGRRYKNKGKAASAKTSDSK